MTNEYYVRVSYHDDDAVDLDTYASFEESVEIYHNTLDRRVEIGDVCRISLGQTNPRRVLATRSFE